MPQRSAAKSSAVKTAPAASVPGTEAGAPVRSAVVVGGGISGLIAARDLARAGLHVSVLEASDAFGGCVGIHQVAGLDLDSGAESFATRSQAVPGLIAELGLADRITTPNSAGSWLQLDAPELSDGAQRMPSSGMLGIPADPLAPDIVRAVGRAGSARAALDRVLPVAALTRRSSLSLGELVRARMGDQVLRRLVAPVVGGVYSADPDVLDVDSVAPGLRAAMATHGSLAAAVGALRKAAPAGSAVAALQGGMGQLSQALVEDLRASGAVLLTGSPVTALRRTGVPDTGPAARAGADGTGPAWQVQAGARQFPADVVVVATDGPAAVDLLSPVLPELAGSRPQPGPGVALVTLVVDQPDLDAHPRGTGVLVARDVRAVDAKALTHATAKWQWLADSTGPGTHVLRLSYGRGLAAGAGEAPDTQARRTDRDLFAQALKDASALLSVPLDVADVVGWDVVRWVGALPSAAVGHSGRVAAVRSAVAGQPGLEAVGAWLAGTGLAAVTADTRSRIRRLVEGPAVQ